MSPAPLPAPRFDSAASVVAAIATHSTLVIAGPDEDRASELAVAVAQAVSAQRSVALGDLTGRAAAVYALAGGEDAPGLAECFRDGLGLNDIARPVPGNPSLFVLPAGAGARTERALFDGERWSRLIRGFGEAGGLLIVVAPLASDIIPVLGSAGAVLVLSGPMKGAPPPITLAGVYAPGASRSTRERRAVPRWAAVAAAVVAAAVGGGAAIGWIRVTSAPDGTVSLRTPLAPPAPAPSGVTSPDTVVITERFAAGDELRASPFSIEVVAASTASNASSLLHDDARVADGPATTISVVELRSGAGRTARWHKVMVGAWRGAASADSALAAMRKERVLRPGEGLVVRAPYAMLLADSASPERARAVVEVWRSKGLVPYALAQDDGSVRVFAGAFETVAQGVAMAAIVHGAGSTPIIAFRTGRPD